MLRGRGQRQIDRRLRRHLRPSQFLWTIHEEEDKINVDTISDEEDPEVFIIEIN